MASFIKLFTPQTWLLIGEIYLLGVLFATLIILIVRRRRKKKRPVKAPRVFYNLKGVWKQFLKAVPREFRHVIRLYRPYLVFGESGSGKSALIDTCTDWKALTGRFFLSHTYDPQLQIYAGTGLWVQEIPQAVLDNTSAPLRRALIGLWRPLFKKKEPQVLITVPASKLLADPVVTLDAHAQKIRGKLNLLSRILKKPARVTLVITHMDEVSGFEELALFLSEESIRLTPILIHEKGEVDFTRALAGCDSHLSRALKTLPAEDYVKVLAFLNRIPEILKGAGAFTGQILKPDAVSESPQITGLSLTSETTHPHALFQPFAPDLEGETPNAFRPWIRHRNLALAILLLGLLLQGGAFLYQGNRLAAGERLLQPLTTRLPDRYTPIVQQRIRQVTAIALHHPVFAYLPNYHKNRCEKLRENVQDVFRNAFLFPRLTRVLSGDVEAMPALYLMAVSGATAQNGLGRAILKEPERCMEFTGISLHLITDYIAVNTHSEKIVSRLRKLSWGTPLSIRYDPQQWLFFFNDLERLFLTKNLTRTMLKRVTGEAKRLSAYIRSLDDMDFTLRLAELLKAEMGIDPGRKWFRNAEISELRRQSLGEFLDFLRRTSISSPGTDTMGLVTFLTHLGDLTVGAGGMDTFRFTIGGKPYEFKEELWHQLVLSCRVSLFMEMFMKNHAEPDGMAFFDKSDLVREINSPDVDPMDAPVFVEWRFTRDAFEKRVKPVIASFKETENKRRRIFSFRDFIDTLPVSRAEKTAFKNFVQTQISAYAASYAKRYQEYYAQNMFPQGVNAPVNLRYMLDQIQLPTSRFSEFFTYLYKNTHLELDNLRELGPMALELAPFRFIANLVECGDDPSRLTGYRQILLQMQEELAGTLPSAPPAEGKMPNLFTAELASYAAVSLRIFKNDMGSYLNKVESWLTKAEVRASWQAPFRKPVLRAYQIGLDQLEAAVSGKWQQLYLTRILPVTEKFPFRRFSSTAATLSEIEELLHPAGDIRIQLEHLLRAVCKKENNRWVNRVPPAGHLSLPDGMLNMANNMEILRQRLWDENGDPIPMEIFVKPSSLPATAKKAPLPVLSYLKTGENSAFGFNQFAHWQRFELKWWEPELAAVGLEFLHPEKKEKKLYRNILVPRSDWSFFRLLAKARLAPMNEFIWKVPAPSPDTPLEFSFITKYDPWRYFTISNYADSVPKSVFQLTGDRAAHGNY